MLSLKGQAHREMRFFYKYFVPKGTIKRERDLIKDVGPKETI
jgi:hypothetical protein